MKKKEINDFKADLKSIYKLEFNVRYTKYYNIAYMCSEKEMNVLEEKLKIFYNDTYSRYFMYEPRFTLRIIFFKNKNQFVKVMGFNTYGVYYPESPDYYTNTEKISTEGKKTSENMHVKLRLEMERIVINKPIVLENARFISRSVVDHKFDYFKPNKSLFYFLLWPLSKLFWNDDRVRLCGRHKLDIDVFRA